MKTCTIEGCGREHNARGLCNNHYESWRRANNPEVRARELQRRKDYYAANREVISAKSKRKYKMEPTPKRLASRQYYAEKKESISAARKTAWAQRSEEQRAKDSRRALDNKYRNLFGVTLEKVERVFEQQGNACAVCRIALPDLLSPEKRRGTMNVPTLDHCHKTGRLRGILCNHCNRGLGLFHDDSERLRAAADYLSR